MKSWLDDHMVEIALAVCLIAIIVIGAVGVIAIQRTEAACRQRGGEMVIVGYTTTYITQKVGNTYITTPVQTPITKCSE